MIVIVLLWFQICRLVAHLLQLDGRRYLSLHADNDQIFLALNIKEDENVGWIVNFINHCYIKYLRWSNIAMCLESAFCALRNQVDVQNSKGASILDVYMTSFGYFMVVAVILS